MMLPTNNQVGCTAQKHRELLTLIRHCRDFGFSVDDTRTLVSLASRSDKDCIEAREIAQVHLNAVRAKLAKLLALERSLSRFVTACTQQCVGGPAPKCTILKDLSLGDAALTAKQAKSAATPTVCCG